VLMSEAPDGLIGFHVFVSMGDGASGAVALTWAYVSMVVILSLRS